MKMKIAVSVCDEEGRLVAFQRMDGVFSESIPLAIGKAIVGTEGQHRKQLLADLNAAVQTAYGM